MKWWFHRAKMRWHAYKVGCSDPRWHPTFCKCRGKSDARK